MSPTVFIEDGELKVYPIGKSIPAYEIATTEVTAIGQGKAEYKKTHDKIVEGHSINPAPDDIRNVPYVESLMRVKGYIVEANGKTQHCRVDLRWTYQKDDQTEQKVFAILEIKNTRIIHEREFWPPASEGNEVMGIPHTQMHGNAVHLMSQILK
ncbi:hypothetical protein MGYG_06909 [Nannizzia gypsea CBS 118893]|uniref:Uncharacterized protein n=1 Tax=Arthroderma gypseum (strain ATCC MYA-4604 / CBS 118893) TaxID=535722 RepID=E4V1J5_ARTGP|nr:hypothetical protein MGYG_06909 [Nannizzia gypsea CBS 118893]EFR03910.1 hypothetical protein MGYG_06909 [Nannizzia gypsea CBS 118893]